jgi:hypothetical protein
MGLRVVRGASGRADFPGPFDNLLTLAFPCIAIYTGGFVPVARRWAVSYLLAPSQTHCIVGQFRHMLYALFVIFYDDRDPLSRHSIYHCITSTLLLFIPLPTDGKPHNIAMDLACAEPDHTVNFNCIISANVLSSHQTAGGYLVPGPNENYFFYNYAKGNTCWRTVITHDIEGGNLAHGNVRLWAVPTTYAQSQEDYGDNFRLPGGRHGK